MQQRTHQLAFALLLATSPLLLGLGSTGGRDITEPAADFHATLVDRDGVKVTLTRVNIAGDVHLEGKVGRGSLSVPFSNINNVELSAESRDYSNAKVRLKDGDVVVLRVRNSLTIYGRTGIGTYQIRARDLQSIQFES